jgi:DNA-directed RNA polymerase specialized sigma24 family protein
MNGDLAEPLVGNDLDQCLQQLVQVAQQYPLQSLQRQLALNQLVQSILKSHRLGHPQKGRWPPSLYEDFYNEALQKTLLEICHRVDKYNPEYPVMAWVNFCLKNKFIEVVNDYNRTGLTYAPKSKQGYATHILSLDDLDCPVPVEESVSDEQLLRQFLDNDPEGLLKAERLRNHPHVTFQTLAIAKFVEDQTWTDIAVHLGISVQTLCSFFDRRLQKLIPYFQKYLQE